MQVVASVAGAFTRLPRIAYHAGIDRCIVVYQQGTSEFAMYSIEAAVVDGLGTGITPFQVASNAAGSCAAPDLSGDPTGTGQGIMMAANKVKGIRCGVCLEPYSARMIRQHNDANMLALGARVVGEGLALAIVDAFLEAEFEGGRHAGRVAMICALEG
jgi:hypothetical protein